MTILILSSVQDIHARAVMQALSAQGASVELLDLSDFPLRLTVSMAFQDGAREFIINREGGGQLDLSAVSAVWWRRPQAFALPETMTNPAHRRFAVSEATTAFQGLYRAIDAFWINEPSHDAAAHHKPWQLASAQKVGLEIPPTLMTSDPGRAREFSRMHDGHVIYKQFLALSETWRETRPLRPQDFEMIEAVRLTPVIFQRYVEAVADLRVIVIGDEFYAAAADVRKAEYPFDVRYNLNASYEPHTLPPALEDKLRALMHYLELEYGAIDMRLTPDGRYIFLEINPAGQFLYVEQLTGQKIADALARQLIQGRSGSRTEL